MTRIARLLRVLVAVTGGALTQGSARAEPSPPDAARLASLRKDADDAVRRADWPAAREALARLVAAAPNDPAAHYNLACAQSRQGDADGALASLEEAIAIGFVDFFHLARDPDLARVRADPRYSAILAAWGELLDARGEADLDAAKDALGPRYRVERDERLRLNIVSAFDARSTAEALAEVRSVAEWAAANLFDDDALPRADGGRPGPERPHAWVTLILPTTEDFVRFVPTPGVGGIYDKDRRILVSRDLGPGLRHEFLHVLHHRRMSRVGQEHAHWVQEGLGSLVEDFSRPLSGADGAGGAGAAALRPVPNWRTNIAQRLESRGALTPWRTLFGMTSERFSLTRPIANYAQARAAALFLEQRGALRGWLEEYERTYDEDPSGASAFSIALGAPLAEIEREYRAWLRALPAVADEIRPGMPSLGVVVSEGEGEGPVVEQVIASQGARAASRDERLCPRDIITAVGGAPTRTMDDLVRALSERETGEEVAVEIRRGTRRLTVRVALTPRPEQGDVP